MLLLFSFNTTISSLNSNLANALPVTENGTKLSKDYKKGQIFKTNSTIYVCNTGIASGTSIYDAMIVGYTSGTNLIDVINSNLVKKIDYEGTTNSGGGIDVQLITGIDINRWVSIKSGVTDIVQVNLSNGFVVACNTSFNNVGGGVTIKGTLYYI